MFSIPHASFHPNLYAPPLGTQGGGVFMDESTLTVTDSSFMSNSAVLRTAESHARLCGVLCADKPTASHSQRSSVGSRSTPHVHEQPRDQAPSPIHTRISHRSHGHPPPTSRAPPHPPPTRSVVPFNHGRRAAVHWPGGDVRNRDLGRWTYTFNLGSSFGRK